MMLKTLFLMFMSTTSVIMQHREDKDLLERGSIDCWRFHDVTLPICAVEGRLGRQCRPCRQETDI